jgi:hypothetical protein
VDGHRRPDAARHHWNQSLATGALLVGWVLRVTLDIEAVRGELPAR